MRESVRQAGCVSFRAQVTYAAVYCYITACSLFASNKLPSEVQAGLHVCARLAFCVALPLAQFNIPDHYHIFV